MQHRYDLHLLGYVTLTLDGEPLTALRSHKGIALLIYLACTGRAHSRELLADLLWDDTSTAQSLSNLRTVLARLRPQLGDHLVATAETIALAPNAPLSVDVGTLQRQIASLPRHLSPEAMEAAEQILTLYHGDFLADFHLEGATGFEDWALVERERLRFSVLEAMHHLAQQCEIAGNYTAGLRVTARRLALDPLDEATQAQHMRMLAVTGQRAAALAQYSTYCDLLLAELGVEPDTTLQALYAQIRDGSPAPLPAPPGGANALPVPSHNLPEAPGPFLGRDQALADIRSWLSDRAVRLVTLAGEGGVGKSRLAMAAGRQMIGAYPDGVWFVPLVGIATEPKSTLPYRMATAVATAIDFPFARSDRDADLVTQLYSHLRDKEALLILDNFEHLRDGAPFVDELLQAAPRCRVLVTSRQPLRHSDEAVLSIRGLVTPPANAQTPEAVAAFPSVQLFIERARRTQPTFALTAENAPAVAHLCRLVAGSPLALELAAPWVEHFGAAEMVEILERGGFEFLTSAAPDTLPRHRSLHTVFATSWNLLRPSAQRTLAQLSVFRGGFQRQALLAVTDATLADLQVLTSQSLVWRTGPGRYEIHDLLRQFAAAQLATLEESAAPGRPAAAARHSLYYLTRLGAAAGQGHHATQTWAQLAEEIDNIRQAWHRAVIYRDLAAIGAGWSGLAEFYLQRLLFTEAEEAFHSAVQMMQETDDAVPALRHLLALMQVAQAGFLNMLTRYDEAGGPVQAAIEYAEAAGDDAVKARAYLQAGTALYRRGRYAPALDAYQAALTAATTARLKAIEGDILRQIGTSLLEKSDFAAARHHLEQALAIYRQVGNRIGEGNALNDLGWLGQREQNFTDALAYLQAALRLHRAIDNRHGVSIVLINQGIVYEMLGEYNQAYDCYLEVQQLLEELDDRYHRSLVHHSLGVLLSRVGEYAAAHTHCLRSLEIDHELGDRTGMAWTHNNLGLLYHQLGDAKTALAYHNEALRSSKENGARTVQGIAYLGIGQDLYALGSMEAACSAFEAALVVQAELGQRVRGIETKCGLAHTLVALNQSGAALALIDEVLAYLATHTLHGARQPTLVYLTCYRVLLAAEDPRAPWVLREAYLHLQQVADKIADDAWRASFLHNVPANQALIAAYQSLRASPTGHHRLDTQPAHRPRPANH